MVKEVIMFQIELPKDITRAWDLIVPVIRSEDGKHTDIYLTEAIGSPSDYNEACFALATAKEGDTVRLIVNNGGGWTRTAFMLIQAIKTCKATVTGYLAGYAASAATIILMSCDELEVADNSDFMAHNYSHGAEGSGAQVKEYVDFTDREFTKAVKEFYHGFLSEEEMSLISMHDKEIWLNADQVRERWAAKKASE